MSGGFQRALPIGLTIFCGVLSGFYTFKPVFAPKDSSTAENVQGHNEKIAAGRARVDDRFK